MPTAGEGFMQAALVASLTFGLGFASRRPSVARTLIKSVAVGGFMAASVELGDHLLLSAGFAGCTIGSTPLAMDPVRWRLMATSAFTVVGVCLLGLFATLFDPELTMEPVRWVLAAAAVAIGAGYGWWLRPAIDEPRLPALLLGLLMVLATVVSLFVTAPSFSFPSPWTAFQAMGLLSLSAAIVGARQLRGIRLLGSERLTNWAAWFTYIVSLISLSALYIVI